MSLSLLTFTDITNVLLKVPVFD